MQGEIMSEAWVEQNWRFNRRLATYIFHLNSNGYHTQNDEINTCCSKIIKEEYQAIKNEIQRTLQRSEKGIQTITLQPLKE